MNERKCRLFFMQWLTSRSYMCLTEFSAVLFERKKFWKWIVFSAHRIQVHRISASIYCVNPYVDFLSVLCNSQVSYYYSVYRFMSIIMKNLRFLCRLLLSSELHLLKTTAMLWCHYLGGFYLSQSEPNLLKLTKYFQ